MQGSQSKGSEFESPPCVAQEPISALLRIILKIPKETSVRAARFNAQFRKFKLTTSKAEPGHSPKSVNASAKWLLPSFN